MNSQPLNNLQPRTNSTFGCILLQKVSFSRRRSGAFKVIARCSFQLKTYRKAGAMRSTSSGFVDVASRSYVKKTFSYYFFNAKLYMPLPLPCGCWPQGLPITKQLGSLGIGPDVCACVENRINMHTGFYEIRKLIKLDCTI